MRFKLKAGVGLPGEIQNFPHCNSIPNEKEAQLFPTNQTTLNCNLLIKLALHNSLLSKGINNLSMDDIQKFMGEPFNPRKFLVKERYKFLLDLNRKECLQLPQPGSCPSQHWIHLPIASKNSDQHLSCANRAIRGRSDVSLSGRNHTGDPFAIPF